MRTRLMLLAGIGFCALAGVAYQVLPALSQTTFGNPTGTAVTTTSTDNGASRQIIGSNPTRRAIQICNPSAVVWWIAPSPITPAANGAGSYGLPANSTGTTVCYTVPSNFPNSVGAAWNGKPASTPATLSVYEFN
jgi:hypothetical protein